MIESPPKFWMVYSPERHAPTYRHETRASADTEAMRLAALHPGRVFFVLKAVMAVYAEEPNVVAVRTVNPPKADGVPF